MGKTTRWTGCEIVVMVRRLGDYGGISVPDSAVSSNIERDTRDRYTEVARDIKRHCDNVRDAYCRDETEPVCEHCGSRWTEDSPTYNGGCCDKDEAANPTPEPSR